MAFPNQCGTHLMRSEAALQSERAISDLAAVAEQREGAAVERSAAREVRFGRSRRTESW